MARFGQCARDGSPGRFSGENGDGHAGHAGGWHHPRHQPKRIRISSIWWSAGYVLFGIIIDADIEVTDNRVYQSERRISDYRDFQGAFDEILKDERYALLYAHLSTAPQSFLREMILYTYKDAAESGADMPPLGEVQRPLAQAGLQPFKARSTRDAAEMVGRKIRRATT